jgi:hypothetical protein
MNCGSILILKRDVGYTEISLSTLQTLPERVLDRVYISRNFKRADKAFEENGTPNRKILNKYLPTGSFRDYAYI